MKAKGNGVTRANKHDLFKYIIAFIILFMTFTGVVMIVSGKHPSKDEKDFYNLLYISCGEDKECEDIERNCIELIDKLGKDALTIAIDVFQKEINTNIRAKLNAIWVMRRFKDKRVAEVLISDLNRGKKTGCEAVEFMALADIGETKAIPVISKYLYNEEYGMDAVFALEKMGKLKDMPEVIKVRNTTESWFFKTAIDIFILKQEDSEISSEAIAEYAYHKNVALRVLVRQSLKEMKNTRAKKLLNNINVSDRNKRLERIKDISKKDSNMKKVFEKNKLTTE